MRHAEEVEIEGRTVNNAWEMIHSPVAISVTRRLLLFAIPTVLTAIPFVHPTLGDAEWMRRFKDSIRAFNDFVLALNDEKLDREKWERLRATWKRIDVVD